MRETEQYAVVRFIEKKGEVLQAKDRIKGQLLLDWICANPLLEREALLGLIRELGKCLLCYHKGEKQSGYGYVNPYGIVVGKKLQLYLLDVSDERNERLLRKMQTKIVRENFLSQEIFCMEELERDLYGFGQTVQFLLSQCQSKPVLGRVIEGRLLRLLKGCRGEGTRPIRDKKRFQRQLMIATGQGGTEHKRKWKKWSAITACAVLGVATGKELIQSFYEEQIVYAREEGERAALSEVVAMNEELLEKMSNLLEQQETVEETLEDLKEQFEEICEEFGKSLETALQEETVQEETAEETKEEEIEAVEE